LGTREQDLQNHSISDIQTMNSDGKAGLARTTILQVLVWVMWAVFLLFCSGASLFAVAVRRDVYFVRHYEHFPMDTLTSIMTAHPVWMVILPCVCLPVIISYQQRRNPGLGGLLLLAAAMFAVSLTVAVLLLCSGPGIQM
jgi:hypothetical protein